MGVIRSIKNVTKGYSPVQIKVRNATSNHAAAPTEAELADIAAMTFASRETFHETMKVVETRLNDKGKNWRHVLKSLVLLDYLLHEGSAGVLIWCRRNSYLVRTLCEFQYVDDTAEDAGHYVRSSARNITSLINDEERLRRERYDRGSWIGRINEHNHDPYVDGTMGVPPPRYAPPTPPPRARVAGTGRQTAEDVELRLAIAASKAQAEEEDRRRREQDLQQQLNSAGEDEDLALAIKLSLEEEEDRRKQMELDALNAALLFDDVRTPPQTPRPQILAQAQAQPQLQTTTAADQQPQVTSIGSIYMPSHAPQAAEWNKGYQQQAAVDWFGNPANQQQSQPTGFFSPQYSQPTGVGLGIQTNPGSNPYSAQLLQNYQQAQPQQLQRPQEQSNVPLIDLLEQSATSAASRPEKQEPQIEETATGMLGQAYTQHRPSQVTPVAKSGSNNPFLASQLTSWPRS